MLIEKIYTAISKIKSFKESLTSLRVSFIISCVIHFLLILTLCITLPKTKPTLTSETQENVILVDTINIKEYTNLLLKQSEKDSGKKTKQHSSIIEENDEIDALKPKEKSPEIKSDEKEEKKIPLKKAMEIPINKLKPKIKSIPKVKKPSLKPISKVEEELSGLLKSIDLVDSSVKNTSKGKESGLIGKGESKYNKKAPISQNVLSAIKSQFIGCWVLPVGSFEIEKLNVVIRIDLDEYGEVKDAEVINYSTHRKNKYFKIMADSALRAVHKCSPIIGLPIESYDNWKSMELNFDPSRMF